MKRILFVDYLSPEGHLAPTRIQIESLHELGYDVYTVFKEGYYEALGVSYSKKYIDIPLTYYVGIGSHIKSRISYIRILLYLKKTIQEMGWDYVILQGYEPISLYLLPIFKSAFIVDHNTVSYLDNPIKRFFLTHLKKEYTHIVFNESIREALIESGIQSVEVVPVGMNRIQEVKSWSILGEYKLQKKKYIFSPSASSSDIGLLTELCNNDSFAELLKKEDLRFVVKGSFEIPDEKQKHIIVIRKYLSSQDYDCLMKEAALIMIAYPSTFKYRISGVQLECLASNIKCILSNIPAFRAYERFFKHKYVFFDTIDDIIRIIPLVLREPEESFYNDYSELLSVSSAWEKVMK